MGKCTVPKESNLELVTEAADFFKERVTRALESQKVEADPTTEYYLVDLLTRFMASESFFAVDESGTKRQEALALLLGEAMSSSDAAQRQRGLRRLGDVSLYTAGFFQDNLARKIVDVDYYIGMGRSAYGNLATMGVQMGRVFGELSQKFHRFVDVLGEVSEGSGSLDAKNVLRQYEVWLKTRSARAEERLKEAGIVPNKLVKPDWQ